MVSRVPATSTALAPAIDGYFVARSPRKDSEHTVAAYRNDLTVVSSIIADQTGVAVDDLTVEDLTLPRLRAAFAAYAATRAKTTIRRCWSTWHGFFNHLVSEGIVEGNPMAGVAKPTAPPREPKAFSAEATERILSTLISGTTGGRDPWPERDLAIIFTALVTGMRASELLSVRIDSISGPEGERRIRVRGKGDKDRTIPIEPGLEDIIDAYLSSRIERFPAHASRRNLPEAPRAIDRIPVTAPLWVDRAGEALQRGGLQYLVRSAYRRAGVESERERGALIHALRHTFATRLIENPSTSVVQLMELLGHKSMATTQVYVRAAGREVRAAAASNPIYRALKPR